MLRHASSHTSSQIAIGVTLGQILTTVQRLERKMDAVLRAKPSRIEARLKDWAGILIFLATLYLTGSLHDSLAAFLRVAAP